MLPQQKNATTMNLDKIKAAHSRIKTIPISFICSGRSFTVLIREGKDPEEVKQRYIKKYAI